MRMSDAYVICFPMLHTISYQGFFSKFLMGGTQNFLSVPDGDEVGWGGLAKKIQLKPKLPT